MHTHELPLSCKRSLVLCSSNQNPSLWLIPPKMTKYSSTPSSSQPINWPILHKGKSTHGSEHADRLRVSQISHLNSPTVMPLHSQHEVLNSAPDAVLQKRPAYYLSCFCFLLGKWGRYWSLQVHGGLNKFMLWSLKTVPGTKQVLSTSYYHNHDHSYALSHNKGPSIRKCYTNDQMLRALVSGFFSLHCGDTNHSDSSSLPLMMSKTIVSI